MLLISPLVPLAIIATNGGSLAASFWSDFKASQNMP
jgi:hypothetical protein